VNDVLAQLDSDSIALADRPTFGLSDTVLTSAVATIQAVIGRLVAVQAALVREVDGRGLVKRSGSVNPSAWLRDRARVSIAEAHKVTALGTLLDARPDLAAAVAAGNVTTEQALAIGRVLADLPGRCEPAVTEKVVATLVDHAGRFEPAILRKLGDRVLAHIAPDVAEELLQRRLEREERQEALDRTLTLSADGWGRVHLRGVLGTESAAVVRAALEPLMTPIPTSHSGSDLRTPAMRRADALVEVCRLALRTGALPADGGTPPQLNITTTIAALRGALRSDVRSADGAGKTAADGARQPITVDPGYRIVGPGCRGGVAGGVLDTGETLTAAAIRRLACDARVLPIVLDSAGVPIDVGRSRRLFTGAIRTAILIRDGGCTFPGCDRPPRWCDIHHVVPWYDGGATDRDNGAALCGYHHRLIHRDGWTIRIGDDRRPEFIPPAHIDPTRTPQRNPYHQRT
jgi:ADP-ribose pyrophosphatase YjhB (NUDIX family)